MARKIPVDVRSLKELSSYTELELSKLEATAKAGYISKAKLSNPAGSYLFIDDGSLKYYDADTGIVKTISVT
jgi:hypothetical protein